METCIFCKMANKEIMPNIVYEDADLLAFKDIAPRKPVHVLIIPKKHIASLAEAQEEDLLLLGKIQLAAKKNSRRFGHCRNRLPFGKQLPGRQRTRSAPFALSPVGR